MAPTRYRFEFTWKPWSDSDPCFFRWVDLGPHFHFSLALLVLWFVIFNVVVDLIQIHVGLSHSITIFTLHLLVLGCNFQDLVFLKYWFCYVVGLWLNICLYISNFHLFKWTYLALKAVLWIFVNTYFVIVTVGSKVQWKSELRSWGTPLF